MGTKSALITGVTGQDGSYLAELLLQNGYRVTGLVRRGRAEKAARSGNLAKARSFGSGFDLLEGDLLDQPAFREIVRETYPDEIYHLAAPSHVGESFVEPTKSKEWIENATANVLEVIVNVCPEAKFFNASSAEIFGDVKESPQTETTPFSPVSPYGIGKAAATTLVRQFRERHGLFACNGIMYNHESPRRGPNFVTQKIAQGVAAVAAGTDCHLRLGALDSRRDWGHAKDFARAIWMILEGSAPDDYIIATGETHSVREFVTEAFAIAGLKWEQYVISDPLMRRTVDPQLVGDPEKIRNALGWRPEFSFGQLITEMVQAALKEVPP